MINVTSILVSLSVKRPIFHSEADFQHSLAWEIHSRHPDANLRLEIPIHHFGKNAHLDLWMSILGTTYVFELKYKTRGLRLKQSQEEFNLKNQSAQDVGRYDFLTDIGRLERIVSKDRNTIGYAVLLTNDSAYWKDPLNPNTVDVAFRIHEGRSLSGHLAWDPRASKGTKRNREEPIELIGQYRLHWRDYSRPSNSSYGKFRYLATEVVSPRLLAT